MRIGSLFSGIGGLELGLEWAGVGHTVWQVEREPFCLAVLAKHWPDVRRFDDVCTVGTHNLEPVDVICGGYPCQPFSHAGDRNGADDPRHLWPEFSRILGEMGPRYAVLENVPGHLSLGFGDVLGDLADLGYDAEWGVLSAAGVGAPHLRRRVFVVAHAKGQRRGEARGDRERSPERTAGSGALRDADRERGEEYRAEHQLCEATGEGTPGRTGGALGGGWWGAEPGVGRVADGVPNRAHRLRGLGNAIVPQIAFLIGRAINQVEAES